MVFHRFPFIVVFFFLNSEVNLVRLYQPRDYMGAYCDIEATASAQPLDTASALSIMAWREE